MKKFKTLFLSDIHLGSGYTKSREFFKLLREIEVENLILVGDIFNISANDSHKDILEFKKIISSKSWNIIYILGNHEKERKLPSIELLPNIEPIDEYIYINKKHKVYICHGDEFHNKDIFNKILKYLLIKVKKLAKKQIFRRKKRLKSRRATIYHTKVKPYAQKLLHDSYVKYITNKSQENGCNIAICGHIHLPEKIKLHNMIYLNCGDWVNYSSYIVEDFEGNFKLIGENSKTTF